ncbi:hypothetical protein [Gorillibacterium sp. CAU 1737]|uniref:hypothetical protein n=1 Tax=Gorillibacterium sp. CAU 1737 TaxID=3140362 RepID=UPI0032606FC9
MLPTPAPRQSFRHLLDPAYLLCRNDLIWALMVLKQKTAEGTLLHAELPRPNLVRNVHAMAELALALLRPESGMALAQSDLKTLLREASAGIVEP